LERHLVYLNDDYGGGGGGGGDGGDGGKQAERLL
jgi:hypothetical protein